MHELIETILKDLHTEISHAEARSDHRAVDVLKMVINRIEAREYEWGEMQQGRIDMQHPRTGH